MSVNKAGENNLPKPEKRAPAAAIQIFDLQFATAAE